MRLRACVIALVFCAACGSSGSGSGPSSSGSGAPAGSGSPAAPADDKAQEEANVKLVQPGAAPLSQLRYRVTDGAAETLVILQSRTEAMVGQKSRTVPTSKMTLSLVPKAAGAGGDREWSYEVKDVSIESDGKTSASLAAQLDKEVKKMIGLKGSLIVSNRGHVRKVDPVTPPGADPTTAAGVKQLADSMTFSFVPLPAAAVGPGAVWEHTFEAPQMGMTVKSVARYELVSAAPDAVKIKISSSSKADKQTIDAGGGQKIEVSGFQSDTTGEVTLNLAFLTPRASKSEAKSSMTMEGLGKAAKEIKTTTAITLQGL